jgi:hypothetical protein
MVTWKILLFPKDLIRGLMAVPLLLPAVIAGVGWEHRPAETDPGAGRRREAVSERNP